MNPSTRLPSIVRTQDDNETTTVQRQPHGSSRVLCHAMKKKKWKTHWKNNGKKKKSVRISLGTWNWNSKRYLLREKGRKIAVVVLLRRKIYYRCQKKKSWQNIDRTEKGCMKNMSRFFHEPSFLFIFAVCLQIHIAIIPEKWTWIEFEEIWMGARSRQQTSWYPEKKHLKSSPPTGSNDVKKATK